MEGRSLEKQFNNYSEYFTFVPFCIFAKYGLFVEKYASSSHVDSLIKKIFIGQLPYVKHWPSLLGCGKGHLPSESLYHKIQSTQTMNKWKYIVY